MSNDIEREAFERWAKSYDMRPLEDYEIDDEGYYEEGDVQRLWSAWQAARTQPEQLIAGVVPDMTSAIVNDCCWTFVEAMPHNLPGPIFNDLKPALYEALKQYHGSVITADPAPQAVQGGGVPVGTIIDVGGQQFIDMDDETLNSLPVGTKLYTHPNNGEQGGERCSWWKDAEDWDGNNWESDCGAYWTFIDEGPAQNEMHYCPKCGRKLSQLPQPPKSKEDRGHE